MNDEGSAAGWGVLSFFFPMVGLILFCVWRDEKPQTSKVCGICALVSFCLSILVPIIITIFYFVFIVLLAGLFAAGGSGAYYLIPLAF